MSSVKLDDKLLDALNAYYRSYETCNNICVQECLFCYTHLANSSLPFYLCLRSYLGFCAQHVSLYLDKNQKFFIRIERKRKPPKVITDSSTSTSAAISTGDYEDLRSIVIGDEIHGIRTCLVEDGFLSTEMLLLLNSDVICKKSVDSGAIWSDPDLKESSHARDLKQTDTGVIVGNSGWKCEKCGLDTNLWLNLTDGKILCGRPSTGIVGNNHSYEHYSESKNGIVVKLTSLDTSSSEVYSYIEDKMVIDPFLDKHLKHFGINRDILVRKETTIREKEMALNISFQFNSMFNENYDKLSGNGKARNQLLFGPGYTGIYNLGNTCYMASVLQILFNINEIVQMFSVNNFPLSFLSIPHAQLMSDVYFHLCKFCFHIYSGEYSQPVFDEDGNETRGDGGIKPILLKRALTIGHSEFGGFHQQDCAEFFLFLCDKLSNSKASINIPDSSDFVNKTQNQSCSSSNLSQNKGFKNSISIDDLFDFKVREYYQSQQDFTEIVERISREKILRIHIPADNSDISIQNDLSKSQQENDSRNIYLQHNSTSNSINVTSSDSIASQNNIPQNSNTQDLALIEKTIPWDSCVDLFCAPSSIDKMKFKTHTGPGVIYYRLASLPKYLVVQICRFSLDPITYQLLKLNVKVTPPKFFDISRLVATPDFSKTVSIETIDDSQIGMLAELVGMGFEESLVRKAILQTKAVSVDQALDWIISHPKTPDENPVSDESIQMLVSMGFMPELARKALIVNNGNPTQSVDYLLTKLDCLERDYQKIAGVAEVIPPVDSSKAKYELCGFISHMGNSPTVGHYLCHVYREDQWVVYNDNYVAECQNPPFEDGYLYFYRIKD